jgi:hypothetical protein
MTDALDVLRAVFAPVDVLFYVIMAVVIGAVVASQHADAVRYALLVSLPFTVVGIVLNVLHGNVVSGVVLASITGRASLFIFYCIIVWLTAKWIKGRYSKY